MVIMIMIEVMILYLRMRIFILVMRSVLFCFGGEWVEVLCVVSCFISICNVS